MRWKYVGYELVWLVVVCRFCPIHRETPIGEHMLLYCSLFSNSNSKIHNSYSKIFYLPAEHKSYSWSNVIQRTRIPEQQPCSNIRHTRERTRSYQTINGQYNTIHSKLHKRQIYQVFLVSWRYLWWCLCFLLQRCLYSVDLPCYSSHFFTFL